jgi:hypothetical protein
MSLPLFPVKMRTAANDDNDKPRSRWTKQMDEALQAAVVKHRRKKWKNVAEEINFGVTSEACRNRFNRLEMQKMGNSESHEDIYQIPPQTLDPAVERLRKLQRIYSGALHNRILVRSHPLSLENNDESSKTFHAALISSKNIIHRILNDIFPGNQDRLLWLIFQEIFPPLSKSGLQSVARISKSNDTIVRRTSNAILANAVPKAKYKELIDIVGGKNSFEKGKRDFEELVNDRPLKKRANVCKIPDEELKKAGEFVLSYCNIIPSKFRTAKVGNTQIQNVPLMTRSIDLQRMFSRFKDSGGKVGKRSFNMIANAISKEAEISTCVDYRVTDICEHFQNLSNAITRIGFGSPTELSHLTKLLKAAEVFILHDFFGHIHEKCDKNQQKIHCMRYAVGLSCECLNNEKCCIDCTVIRILPFYLRDFLTNLIKAEPHPNYKMNQNLEDIIKVLGFTFQQIVGMMAHQLRRKVQMIRMSEIRKSLGQNKCYIILDFAQKIIPSRNCESSASYYGKSGMTYFGAAIFLPLVGNVFFDYLILESSSQTSLSVIPLLFVLLQDIYHHFPSIQYVQLQMDNANSFNSFLLFGFIWILNHLQSSHTRVSGIVFPEPQCGKTYLDTHFSYFKKAIRNELKSQGKKATTPFELFDIICSRPIANSRISLVSLRDFDVKNQDNIKKFFSKVVKQRSVSEVQFEEKRVLLFKHSNTQENQLTLKKVL